MKRLQLQPFGYPLDVGVGDDEWPALMRRIGITDAEEPSGCDARTYFNPDRTPAHFGVWVHGNGPDAPLPALAGVLAHEAVHVVDFMLERVGETAALEELHAYYVGHVTEFLMDAVLRRRR